MPFVEPSLLWGALAVTIPVAVHFWHQKRGKPLPWAATQWLTEKQQQQSRGLRLDNIRLLIVRCLLLVLLAILLAQPILNWFTQPPPIQKVHLVQANTAVTDNFKFEITNALKKGERAMWATNKLVPITDYLSLPESTTPFSALGLQTAINQVDTKNTELHIYLVNNQPLANVPAITVPARFQLHTVVDSTSQLRPYLVVKNDRKLFINRAGRLISVPVLDPTLKFQSAPVHSGPIRVLLGYQNGRELQTVKAALTALTDIYGLDLTVDSTPSPNRSYTWILTDQPPVKPPPQTLYIVSGIESSAGAANVFFTNETLTPQTSERVATGQLPEWLGEQLLRYYGLETNHLPLSQQDLKTLFVTSGKPTTAQHTGIQSTLLLFFVILLALERWLALTKNA